MQYLTEEHAQDGIGVTEPHYNISFDNTGEKNKIKIKNRLYEIIL